MQKVADVSKQTELWIIYFKISNTNAFENHYNWSAKKKGDKSNFTLCALWHFCQNFINEREFEYERWRGREITEIRVYT